MIKKSIILLLVVSATIISCKKKKTDDKDTEFDKSGLLSDLTEHIILPNYNKLSSSVETLKTSWSEFKSNPTSTKLAEVQTNWLDANKNFQRVKLFNFGPALKIDLRAALGTFPADTVQIANNLNVGSYDLTTSSNHDAIGFPAIEYLIYRVNALTELSNSNIQKEYIDALISKMEFEITTVINGWNGGYASSFKSSTGTESTSGFSVFVNAFNMEYELAKNAKLGIPIGKQSLGIIQTQYAEAPFSGKSLYLLKENILGIQAIYQGMSNEGNNKVSFDDYLIAVDKQALNTEIENELTIALADFNNLSDNLVNEINDNPTKLDALYTKLQNLVVHFKTDMTSAFGVLITYQDNDGD